MTEAVNQMPHQEDLIISPEELKRIWLFGIDMTDDDGNEFPKEMFEFHIRAAQNWLESQIPGLILCKKQIDTSHDYYINDYVSYSFIKLKYFPVRSVEEVNIQFPMATDVIKFDPKWYRVQSQNGQVNLVPTSGTFSSILLSQGGSFLPLFYSGIDHVPNLWHIRATYGFEKGNVPANIKEIIGMKAAMGPLNVAGDLIAGAGIASKSIGLDGLSQSISTTSSATNAGYGARILQYNKEIDNRLEDLRRLYSPINMVMG